MNEFRARPLPWLVVHHLLDAELLRELLSAIVEESSSGRLTLTDLFEETLIAGNPATADWFLAARDAQDAFASFLSRLILSVVWRGDDARFGDSDGLGADEADWARSLIGALSLGTTDFGSDPGPHGSGRILSLAPFATAMAEAREALSGNAPTVWLGQIKEATADAPSLLCALFIKHFGDLFGDADRWDLALDCYRKAAYYLGEDKLWDGAIVRTKQIVAQSVAMATWHWSGPEPAAALLDELVSQSTIGASPLPLLNASLDLMNARAASGQFLTAWTSGRPAICTAPLLLHSHHLNNALSQTATGRFGDSSRWFWASLRRQTALGGATTSSQTKGQYGRAIIDELEASSERERRPEVFAMGVRLLVESGRTEFADATLWSERLVEGYLTKKTLDELRATTARSPGTSAARELVAISLRTKWLLAIPRDKVDLARDMLVELAASARLGQHTGMSNRNTGGVALKSLKTVALERPEFRGLLGPELLALVDEMRQRAGPLPVAEAFEAAARFVDGVSLDAAEALCRRATELVDALPSEAFWPVKQAASELLGSGAASAFSRRDPKFRRMRSVALVKLALNSMSDHESLLYLLRDVDPSVLLEQIGMDGLAAVVDGIRERARDTSSSAATGSMHALLVAPKVAGEAGVGEVVDAMGRVMRSAAAQRPSPSLINGYEVLLLLARNGDRIAEDLGPAFDLRASARPLLGALNDMWLSAAARPLIFAGFAIPARTAPDSVIVHNWTFATLEFLSWLGAGPELDDALAAAAANEFLAEGMSTARAVHATASELLDADTVAKERADAFYAALGQRLVAVGFREDSGAAASLRVLLDRCLQLGPRGEDAALLLASRRLSILLDPEAEAVNTYDAKLRRDPKLRLSLSPLFRACWIRPPHETD